MKIEYINPFLNGAVNTVSQMAKAECSAGKPVLKVGITSWGMVTGVIGLASANVRGNVMLSFDEQTILGIASAMLMETFTEINKEVVDAVGELTNIIVGHAKREFSEMGLVFDMAILVMLVGKDIEISQLTKGPTITVPFTTQFGGFVVEVNLNNLQK